MILNLIKMITNEKPTWDFLNKWVTYDDPPHEPSNKVICPICAPLFKYDPSLRELQDQRPDPTRSCGACDRQWL